MKKTIMGVLLLSIMLGLLMLFPVMAGFMGKNTHSVDVNKIERDLKRLLP